VSSGVVCCGQTFDGFLDVRKPSSSSSIMPASDVSRLESAQTSVMTNTIRPTRMPK